MTVCITVDMEQDCPPYLQTWRGAEAGAPRLLELLHREGVPATFFTTGEFARRYPDVVGQVVSDGHELACHGDSHRSFRDMSVDAAAADISRATATLRALYPVRSFRAPYLQFPNRFLPLLVENGYRVDSSVGRHKTWPARVERIGALTRIPVSVTSSTLRWPRTFRSLVFTRLQDPVVLFVHPWEFVDLRREHLRFDCRFKTGAVALECLRESIAHFRDRHARFATMQTLAGA